MIYLIRMGKPAVTVGRRDDAGADRGDAASLLRHLETLAWLLDSSIPVPGTRFRIGIESLIGLVPVLGDAIGAILSAYIVGMAARLGVPRLTLLRMGFNIALEAVVGVIPVAGDLFDFAWKANRRNVGLIRAQMRDPARARRGDWLFTLSILMVVLALVALTGWAGYSLGRWILMS